MPNIIAPVAIHEGGAPMNSIISAEDFNAVAFLKRVLNERKAPARVFPAAGFIFCLADHVLCQFSQAYYHLMISDNKGFMWHIIFHQGVRCVQKRFDTKQTGKKKPDRNHNRPVTLPIPV